MEKIPYIQVLSLIPTLLLAVSSLVQGSFMGSLIVFVIGLALSYAGTAGFALILAVLSPYEVKKMVRPILMFPVFTISWMPLCIAALFIGGGSWEQIRHSRALTLKELGYAR